VLDVERHFQAVPHWSQGAEDEGVSSSERLKVWSSPMAKLKKVRRCIGLSSLIDIPRWA